MTIRMKRIVEFRNSIRGHVFDTYLVPFFKDHGCLFDSRDIIGIVEQVNNYVESLPVTSVDKAILNVRYPVWRLCPRFRLL